MNYYNEHKGDLAPGRVAKSSDIMQIQENIKDAFKNAINDLTEGQSWILGKNDQSDRYSFILVPENKRAGRYIDQMNLASENDAEVLSIRETSFLQPIRLSRSSLYSVIVKLQNRSEETVPVVFELRDENGYTLPNMRTVLQLPKYTNEPTEFEVVFDLDYYPTAHELESHDLENGNTQIPMHNNPDESSDILGTLYHEGDLSSGTIGGSEIYFYVEALNRNKIENFSINKVQSDNYRWNDTDPTFGIVANKNSSYGQLLKESSGNNFVNASIPSDLYFKEVFANAPTYRCTAGEAIIAGEKVGLVDTHVSVAGGSSQGNVKSYIYMDLSGRLRALNSKPFSGVEPKEYEIPQAPHLHIADITTFLNDSKAPIIEQSDETREFRPRSHHERIRRLENKLGYTQNIAIPPRLKYTITGDSWIDEHPEVNLSSPSFNGLEGQKLDALDSTGYSVITDENGNFVVKMGKAESFTIPITLKDEKSGKVIEEDKSTKILTDDDKKKNTALKDKAKKAVGDDVSATKIPLSKVKYINSAQSKEYIDALAKDNIARAQVFAEMKNVKNDLNKGELTLATTGSNSILATTDKEAKATEFNPWDDAKENRPKTADVTPITRHYTVRKGRNGANDWASEFPAMTFYTNTGYKLKKLEIPIYKFKNCSGIKFIIFERQGPNNKTNTVWLKQRIHTTKVFSLKNAKEKKGYQYIEDGFLIDFGAKGLTLPKGQYVIVCLPIPKNDKGTVYVDTYKPEKSKDFCIRYYGAGNASHFLLKERYHEIWYNSVKATGEPISYAQKGSVISGVVAWDHKEAIKSIKPIVNKVTEKGTEVKVSVDVGGGWVDVALDKENDISGSGNGDSFRWKVEMSGDGKTTPVIKYDEDKKYAISFEITRADPKTTNTTEAFSIDKNLCFTSIPFDANKILREYMGDYNLGVDDNKFSNYEFARVWVRNDDTIKIDLSASDRTEKVIGDVPTSKGNFYYPVYSLHYVDLSLRDFSRTSVDYSNYDNNIEEDEYNLRLKLDTENSYNDEDIRVCNIRDFKAPIESSITQNESYPNSLSIDLNKVTVNEESNVVIAKAVFDNYLDLSKYAALRTSFALSGTPEGSLNGVAIYISSQETDGASIPTTIPSDDLSVALVDDLPDLDLSQEEVIATYANKIIRKEYNNNGIGLDVYYRSVWDSSVQKWRWEQVHDIKPYNIYELSDRKEKTVGVKLTEGNNNKESFFDIEIDKDSTNLQFVKEIGIVLLGADKKYNNENVDTLSILNFKAIKNDYYPVFTAKNNDVFVKNNARSPVVCRQNGNLWINPKQETVGGHQVINPTFKSTVPPTSSITITCQNETSSSGQITKYGVDADGEDLCSFDLTSKSTKDFNHIGIQLASDCLITKHMLELHFRRVEKDNEITVEKVSLPTLNYSYYSTIADDKINLSQIFKKIETSERFDKVVLYATNKFKNYAAKLKNGVGGNEITLYIGNISLYKATTIPIFHHTMRMKFYLDDMSDISQKKTLIRKIGVIMDYS